MVVKVEFRPKPSVAAAHSGLWASGLRAWAWALALALGLSKVQDEGSRVLDWFWLNQPRLSFLQMMILATV